jgi:hypothetical protein
MNARLDAHEAEGTERTTKCTSWEDWLPSRSRPSRVSGEQDRRALATAAIMLAAHGDELANLIEGPGRIIASLLARRRAVRAASNFLFAAQSGLIRPHLGRSA